jgi:hypothetical protein
MPTRRGEGSAADAARIEARSKIGMRTVEWESGRRMVSTTAFCLAEMVRFAEKSPHYVE